MVEFLTGLKRNFMCGQLRKEHIGQEVTVMGWINRRRDLGGLIFVQIRDRSGIVQAVFDSTQTDQTLFEKASVLKLEYVVAVRGVLRYRDGNVNPEMETGEVEILAEELRILSEAQTTPFSVGDDSANESLRLKYRYLDLRRRQLQHNLTVRSQIAQVTRRYFSENGFLEIETPYLGKSTPEGARDYLVPSRVHNGAFYALPQSPQLYKQLLMIGGMDRYFQIAKCFRDEDLRANRQPEFTQIDVEMSFVDQEDDVITIMEGFLSKLFREVKQIELSLPLRRLTYKEAMENYGSDKPDLRFGMELKDLSDVVSGCGFGVFESAVNNGGKVRCVVLKGKEKEISRKEIDRLTDFVKTYRAKGLAWFAESEPVRSSFAKFLSEETLEAIRRKAGLEKGDLLFAVADSDDEIVCNSLGALRVELAEKFALIDHSRYELLWVVDFPLLEYDYDEKRYVAKHHPFTSPKNEDLPLMKTHPERIRAKAYDIIINGQEAGGGSIRIFHKEVQNLMFETLGFTEKQIQERFGFFVDAFGYGTPPHGGIAFGLDRLTMLLTGAESIRDVIAFPKVQNASDLMTEAPAEVEAKQLKELGIKIDE